MFDDYDKLPAAEKTAVRTTSAAGAQKVILFNRPGVAGAVIQTALSIID